MNTATPIFLLVLTYAVVVVAAGWHVIDRTRRTSIQKRIRSSASFGAEWTGICIRAVVGSPRELWRAAISVSARFAERVWRRRRTVAVAMLLFAAPVSVLIAFGSLSGSHQSFDDLAMQQNPVVAAVLDGEQLVPPAALPPEVFVTREASVDRMELATASREWLKLDPEFKRRLLLVFRAMENHGYRMALLEGYRSPERQRMLAQLGPHVTNAGAFQSYHQFGLAADSAFYRDGRLVISEKDPWAMEGYRLYGAYAESFGLTWGGHWQMRDFGHVELRRKHAVP